MESSQGVLIFTPHLATLDIKKKKWFFSFLMILAYFNTPEDVFVWFFFGSLMNKLADQNYASL